MILWNNKKNIYKRIIFNIKKLNILNINLVQKKFYCNNFSDDKEFSLKAKKNFSQINLQKELENFNREIDLDFIINNMEYFKNFDGYLVMCGFVGSVEKFVLKEEMLGFIFFDVKFKNDLPNHNIFFCRLQSICERDTMLFILKFFLEDNNKSFYNKFNLDNIMFNFKTLFIDKEIPIKYFNFKNLNELIMYLEQLKT